VLTRRWRWCGRSTSSSSGTGRLASPCGGLCVRRLVMAIVAWVAERLVLRKLVNQEGIILFMATIGVTFFLEGLARPCRRRRLSAQYRSAKDPLFILESVFDGGILVNELDIWAAVIAGLLVAGLAIFFQRTASAAHCAPWPTITPRRNRSASAQSDLVHRLAGGGPGRPGRGRGVGQQARRAVLAQLAGAEGLPVLILGGFTSVPAHHRGLVIGAGEKISEVFLGPSLGGGIEIWFAYVVALLFCCSGRRACSANASSSACRRRVCLGEGRDLPRGRPIKVSYQADRRSSRSPRSHRCAGGAGGRLSRRAVRGDRIRLSRVLIPTVILHWRRSG